MLFSLFQSTRPVWGETSCSPKASAIQSRFQSTRPVWGEARPPARRRADGQISIHSPRVGRDASWPWMAFMPCVDFNPLAPCGARLCSAVWMPPLMTDFNPLTPCGARRRCGACSPCWQYFNPLAPCGARRLLSHGVATKHQFQSTRPVWGETLSCMASRALRSISIHSPRVGRDALQNSHIRRAQISIHSLRVGRDVAAGGVLQKVGISIHSPRVGRDHCKRSRAVCAGQFQSTRPVWGETRVENAQGFPGKFQSTRPVWGETHDP